MLIMTLCYIYYEVLFFPGADAGGDGVGSGAEVSAGSSAQLFLGDVKLADIKRALNQEAIQVLLFY